MKCELQQEAITHMNYTKLKMAEANFFTQYPGGFNNPEMIKVGKKHKMDKMIELAQSSFNKTNCKNIEKTCENMIAVISRSSMVSMFEKPKFKSFVNALDLNEKAFLVNGLRAFLHGKQQTGFESMVDILAIGKLAKWSLLTIIPAYFAPSNEIFVKPTTAKNVIAYFEVNDLKYHSTPTWSFYQKYRSLINQAKTQVDESLSSSNAAFSGFLMMAAK